jgi:hypothetical protein
MTRQSLLCCALLVGLFGCSAEAGWEEQEPGQVQEAIQPEHPPLSCTITGDFSSKCRGRGGYSTCEDTTAMCCKTTRDENGNPSTFCSSNPDEVRVAPPPTTPPITAPILAPIIANVAKAN